MPAASVPLVDPESSVLWRASFAIAALGGAMALIALRGAAPGKLGLTAYISAIVLYLLIGLLAIAPHSAARLGLQAAPLRVEAALLIILVFCRRQCRLAAAVRAGAVRVRRARPRGSTSLA
jgi:hypothetical protein